MAHIEFGNTWWGEKWLAALSGTDYSNRLPRGKRYARNGSVKSVDISGNAVSAVVKGSRPRPYKVKISLKKFSPKDKGAVVDAVTGNPLFISRLLNRGLPPELFEIFQKINLPLFPKTWDDISAHCSCPDWAFCCKHIAAVIYLIANEVDKNPFLLFELHDFDIFAALARKGLSAEAHATVAIASSRQLILKKPPARERPRTREERDEQLERLDFTSIPAVREELLSLLGDRPLFYLQKDFKLLLDRALKRFARRIVQESRWSEAKRDTGTETPPPRFIGVSVAISADLELSHLALTTTDQTYSPQKHGGIRPLLARLTAIPRKEYHSHDEMVIALSLLAHFACRLLEQGAVMPEILEISRGYRIRWVPALLNPKVAEMFEAICALSPGNLVETPHLAPAEQVKIVLSGILGEYISWFAHDISEYRDGDATGMFFLGRVLEKAKKFEEQEVAESIALWLSRFHIAHKSFVPLVKVDETDGGFALELLVENRGTEFNEPVPLKKILTLKKYAKAKYGILKDVALLADYLPEIADFLASGGEIRPHFSSAEFEAVLFRHLPTLKLLNIPILLPKGLDRLVRPRLSATVSTSTAAPVKSYLSLDDMLNFQWQVALGDQILSAADFEKLVRGYRGIVKLHDRFVYLDEKEIGQILKKLEAVPRLTSREAVKTVLAGEYEGAALRLDDDVKKTIDDMLCAEPLPVPAALQATLRDYQRRGYEWLAKNARLGFGSLIADDMGLGKTVQVITLLLHLLEEGHLDQNPALVVVPTSLLTNWQREAEAFAPSLKVHTYHGGVRELPTQGINLCLTTYGLVRRDEAKFLSKTWAVVIIDEAQAIKNHGTAQSKAVRKLKAGLRIAMTGTPVENRLTDYWSILDFLNKGYLKGIKAFNDEFATPIEVDRDHHKLTQFRKITSPFILRRLKSDKSIIKDLPDKLEINQYCQLGKAQAALYQTTMDQIMQQIEETDQIERRGLVLKLITALKQICNHPSHFMKKKTITGEASGKTALLLELLRAISDNEEKVLIFTQYTEMGKLLQKLMAAEFASEPLFLHGGLSRGKRDEIVDDFQTKPYVKAMLLSLKAGGTGLNLTAAQNVVHFDLWWNPAVEAQATDRAYRIGQTKNVMVHRLITRGTFEEKIDDMLTDKRELADRAVATGEKWIGDYSNNDLREIFALG
ncbi:MAG: DEAD/DEAH box helicase [Proteobacteria bacterium]|nr:DEAD/DEAH box helicase [Pseudomonadota bacterium]